MKFHIESVAGFPDAHFDDEVPPRSWLLSSFLSDMRGQEDLYLDFLARGEAGERITNLYNNWVHVYPFPDVVVIEDIYDDSLFNNEDCEGPRRCTFLTHAEARQLIQEWVEAQEHFFAERRRLAAN